MASYRGLIGTLRELGYEPPTPTLVGTFLSKAFVSVVARFFLRPRRRGKISWCDYPWQNFQANLVFLIMFGATYGAKF